ncbi:hypothetical protein CEUSTIGMA_g633.t1 [Chlamydomonas eustigma]|uniref:Protein disulfide-isomerase n=1 Tax=Chlamydomonas eustigma TaxID=1157962 RepID=A0A250WRK6_9CHLO|nr:hypothetical protein CEUSTIGMA_g633.t1 [Chlamydomonas eustigma]|eukprot:GAX73180.1 hypothetical protein CEUSTIGMA_g633.t1 [Chlamydomonas eustigma]
MSKFQLVALLMGCLLVAVPFSRNSASAAADEGDDDDDADDVVVLTTKNFDSVIAGSKFALVEFYAPWCGHCKSLAPHYSKAATILKASDPSVVIAKVDATVESELGTKFDVKGYPTLKWFIDGELASDYNGGRDTDGIVSWIKKKTGPFAITVETTESLEELEDDHPVLMVAYFKSLEGAEYEEFKSVALKTEDVPFVQTTDAAVAAAAGLEKPGISAVKNFVGEAREVVAFTGSLTAVEIKTFVTAEKLPLTIEFTQGNSDKIFNSGIKKQIIFWGSAADLSAESTSFASVRAVAKALKGQLVFVTANNEGESHEPITNYFGLKGAASPVIMGFHMEKNKKFRYTGELTEAALSAFANSVLDDTAKADYKSAPIPEEPEDGGVTVVVGKNFDDIVMDPSKDVLLEVYAPWCGHCKKLEPIYKKLAKRFSSVDTVVIAKMDGTENEHPEVEAKGYPTILFYPAGKKTPIPFDGGDRSLKALTKFIKKHAESEYELPKKGDKDDESNDKDEL